MNLRLILGGLKSYLPIPLASYTGTGGTTSGAYCYSVWMRHRTIIERHIPGFRPGIVAELGPGDSIGLGLAALLSGARKYYGMDVLEHASVATNLRVFDELVELFRRRAPIPGDDVYPGMFPRLADYAYPAGVVDESALDEATIQRLRAAITLKNGPDSAIHYACPWNANSVPPGSADLVISQGALQDMDHLPGRDDLVDNLRIMAAWLKPGGVMSHHVELACPGGTPWNHHWGYGSVEWKLIRGRRPYYKNRVPLSEYLRLLPTLGCDVVAVEPTHAEGLPRERLAAPFRGLPDADLKTRAALVVAVKR